MEEEVMEAEVVPNGKGQAVAFRNPQVPATINELAMLRSEALEVIEARAKVLETLHRAAIRATSPEDWVLYCDSKSGSTIAFLQDCGCDRVRDLYGIEVFNVSLPEKKEMEGGFMYLIRGSGRCSIGQQVLEDVEGGRASTDDFCKDKKGVELELAVRKAARANLDGNITRELAGLKSVPVQELEAAWTGTNKSVARCRHGRGFGTSADRAGADNEDAPKCEKCGKVMKYWPEKKDKYKAFWACPSGKEGCAFTIKAAVWEKRQGAKAPAQPEPQEAKAQPEQQGQPQGQQTSVPDPRYREPGDDDEPPPLTDADIPFGGRRR